MERSLAPTCLPDHVHPALEAPWEDGDVGTCDVGRACEVMACEVRGHGSMGHDLLPLLLHSPTLPEMS